MRPRHYSRPADIVRSTGGFERVRSYADFEASVLEIRERVYREGPWRKRGRPIVDQNKRRRSA